MPNGREWHSHLRNFDFGTGDEDPATYDRRMAALIKVLGTQETFCREWNQRIGHRTDELLARGRAVIEKNRRTGGQEP